jgi:hypothetical protein
MNRSFLADLIVRWYLIDGRGFQNTGLVVRRRGNERFRGMRHVCRVTFSRSFGFGTHRVIAVFMSGVGTGSIWWSEVVRHAFGCRGGRKGVQCRGGIGLLALPGNSGVLVLVLRIARRATRLLDVRTDHRHHGVVGNTSLARAVIVENVTKPKLALLHQLSRINVGGERNCEGYAILAELVSGWQ